MKLQPKIYSKNDVYVKQDGEYWAIHALGTTEKGFMGEVKFFFREKESAYNYADMLLKGIDG